MSFNPETSYDCPRCGTGNTHVVSADLLWCYDCRNQTTPDDYLEAIRKLVASLTEAQRKEVFRHASY